MVERFRVDGALLDNHNIGHFSVCLPGYQVVLKIVDYRGAGGRVYILGNCPSRTCEGRGVMVEEQLCFVDWWNSWRRMKI